MLKITYNKGFTLIEMMVSVAVFTIVMTVALGALLSMSESDRKAQTIKSVINNINFSVDSMSRSIRTGYIYHCDSAVSPVTSPRDCTGTPSTSFAYRPADSLNTIVYRLETSNAALCGQPASRVGCIVRSVDGGLNYSPITSAEVYIDTLNFYVTGTASAVIQPKVTILISGVVNMNAEQNSVFNLQTSVTQRLYDQ